MLDCDMNAAFTDGETVTVEDFYSYNHDTPRTDSHLGGGNDYEIISGGLDSNGHINVRARRKLNTGDEYDKVVVPNAATKICWAHIDHKEGWNTPTVFGIF